MRIKLTDVYNPVPGAWHKQFWHSWPDGVFMSNSAVAKPWYKYLHMPGEKRKRWMRMYEVELAPGTKLCRYVQRSRKRAWVVYVLDEIQGMMKVASGRGVPVWMEQYKAHGYNG